MKTGATLEQMESIWIWEEKGDGHSRWGEPLEQRLRIQTEGIYSGEGTDPSG